MTSHGNDGMTGPMEEPRLPPDPEPDPLSRLAAETGALLGELGVRPGDTRWIDIHAETIASLAAAGPPPRGEAGPLRGWAGRNGWGSWLYRLARRAARTER